MPRKGHLDRRPTPGDSVYGSQLATQLINKLMFDGKKSVAESIVYGSFERIRAEVGKNPVEVLEEALKNVMPALEVRPRRVGGATYQVPMEVRPERRTSLGLRWILQYARDRGEKTMQERLASELMDASNGTGGSVRKREEIHRMAEANKAFAHYRW